MSDDNVIKFRKPSEQKKAKLPPSKPPPGKRPPGKRPTGLPPFVILILAALAVGAVTYLLDQQKPAASLPRETTP